MVYRMLSTVNCGNHSNGMTLCISTNGDVFSFGKHEHKAHGQEEHVVFPARKIDSLKHIQSISCSISHSICLDIDGNVFTFGCNKSGQLGVGRLLCVSNNYGRRVYPKTDTLHFTHKPHRVDLPPIKEVSCGSNFSVCLSETGELYSFGSNSFGQLGIGRQETSFFFPVEIESVEDVEFVECGGLYTVCKTFNNEFYVWGANYFGQLGIGNSNNQYLPILCEEWPEDIVDVKCGVGHSLVLTSNREVFSCGSNKKGQLGRETSTDYSNTFRKIDELCDIVRIECGFEHSLCIDFHGSLFVFGDNELFQLGVQSDKIVNKPIKHPNFIDVVDISKGGHHTFVKNLANEIYAFGFNKFSQLGTKTESHFQSKPIQVFQGNEDIWCSNINRLSTTKSARNCCKH